MKISILIPIFNFDVKELVKELDLQCKNTPNLSDYEILLFDDASVSKYENAQLVDDKIKYKELTTNQGRSKIRNLLAKEALFDAVLFLDCDSAIQKADFIKAYVQHYQDNSVVYGGRTYDKVPPEDAYYFRWKYGTEREIVSADKRILNPYRSFMTNNFMITKEVFMQIGLNESLNGYGHEDTLFGIELREKKIPIIHIENPAVHIGLETVDEFLEKTKEGIANLHQLHLSGKIKKEDVKLLSYYYKLKFFPIKQLFLKYYKRKESHFLQNFKTKEVQIRNFDLFKLNILLKL